MPCSGREARGDTSSGRRFPPVRGFPWPESIILVAHIRVENRLCLPSPRADCVREAETCVKSHLKMEFHGFLGDLGNSYRNAHWARGLDYTFRFPILRLTIIREAVFSVSSSLHRDRVMEARFDVCMIWLLIVVRAIDGVMFRREAWVVRSRLYTETCFRLMPYSQGDPPGRGPSA